MIDFSQSKVLTNRYLGAEKKKTVLYNGERYMLKFPHPLHNMPVKKFDGGTSYKNNQFSEHIGSSIFRACGINAQETALGIST